MNYAKNALILVGLASAPLYADDTSPWQFEGSLGIEYGRDDNVVVEEIDFTSALGDNFIRLRAKGDVEYSASDRSTFSTSLSISDLQFNNADRFDLQNILATVGYKYKIDKTTFGFDIRHADAELGGTGFLSLTQYSPYFSTFFGKKNFVRAAYTYLDKELDNNPRRDAESHEAGLDYYFFQNGLTRYFIFATKFRTEDAADDLFDFFSYQIRVAYKQRYTVFSQKNQLTLDFNYRDRDFDEVLNPTIGDFRRDKRSRFRFENTWSATDALDVVAFYEHVRNSSNLVTFDFNENVYSIAVSYAF
jgi:hypothetical protein